jgi:hypothetical protein
MVTEDCVAKDGPAAPRRLTASPRGAPHWDAEHSAVICGLFLHVCNMDIVNFGLHRTVLQKVDPELRRDPLHRHAGRFIVMLRTSIFH